MYVYIKESFVLSDFVNDDEPENRKAKSGQANAKVYLIGPQYDIDIPLKNRNNNSTTLSTKIYIDISVSIYVKKVFLLVFNFFKNLSKSFKTCHHFHFICNYTYILSYKIRKKTRYLVDFIKKSIIQYLIVMKFINIICFSLIQ